MNTLYVRMEKEGQTHVETKVKKTAHAVRAVAAVDKPKDPPWEGEKKRREGMATAAVMKDCVVIWRVIESIGFNQND